MTEPLLRINDLTFGYPGQGQPAVDGVDLMISEGSSLGLVGESGSGKSTLGRCLLGLLRPSGGTILFQGNSLVNAKRSTWRAVRPNLQIVFQDPQTSLNPLLRVETIIADPLRSFGTTPRREIKDRVAELLDLVELSPDMTRAYPHQLSGGQRQRVAIARALASHPSLVVLDEPTSALDVSVGAKILHLLMDIQNKLGTAYLFISHDLATMRQVTDTISVMLSGKIVESGPAENVLLRPQHPYSRALLDAILAPRPQVAAVPRLKLLPQSPNQSPPLGCRLVRRCPFAEERCEEPPPLTEVFGAQVACWLAPIPEDRMSALRKPDTKPAGS